MTSSSSAAPLPELELLCEEAGRRGVTRPTSRGGSRISLQVRVPRRGPVEGHTPGTRSSSGLHSGPRQCESADLSPL